MSTTNDNEVKLQFQKTFIYLLFKKRRVYNAETKETTVHDDDVTDDDDEDTKMRTTTTT